MISLRLPDCILANINPDGENLSRGKRKFHEPYPLGQTATFWALLRAPAAMG